MKIPHMDMVYYFNGIHEGNCLLVLLILAIEGLIQYLSSTNVAVEDNILMEQEDTYIEDENKNDRGINEVEDT
jgi:vacuolar-type H+-ATPase subunit H